MLKTFHKYNIINPPMRQQSIPHLRSDFPHIHPLPIPPTYSLHPQHLNPTTVTHHTPP